MDSARHRATLVPRVVFIVVYSPSGPSPPSIVGVASRPIGVGLSPIVVIFFEMVSLSLAEAVTWGVALPLVRIGVGKRSPSVDEVPCLRDHSAVVHARLLQQVHNALLPLHVVGGNFGDVRVDDLVVGFSEIVQFRALPYYVV